MARTGPTPKAGPRHGTSPNIPTIDVANVPYTGPGAERDLPDIPTLPWYPQTEAWWEIVRVMPHCVLWEPSDWLFAIETALYKNQAMGEIYGGALPTSLITEIRRREDMMGCTMEARRKLGIRYIDMEPDEAAAPVPADGVTDIASAPSRRARLAG